MKNLWNNCKAAFAMFSKIPVPEVCWTPENIKYMFCFFPFVGAVTGVLVWGASLLSLHMGYDAIFTAAMLTLIPVLVTGGIHVDGLLDTADALSSWQERSRRLEILKDSHAGAFAVITGCCYFLGLAGAYGQAWYLPRGMGIIALGFILSRCLSGISVISFPKAKKDGTVAEFSTKATDRVCRNVLLGELTAVCLAMLFVQPIWGAAAIGSAFCIFGYYHHMALKYFGGTTGDLAGWFVCWCELGIAVALAVFSRIVIL